MFQNLIVAASAVIKNGQVVSTLEIGKNGVTTNRFTDNSLNCMSLLKWLSPPAHLRFNLSISVCLPAYL